MVQRGSLMVAEREHGDVHLLRDRRVARIVLDRPSALNALTLPMVRKIRHYLRHLLDEEVRAVIIESSTDRAFCAGGDVRQIRQNSLDGNHQASRDFFEAEYEVNAMLAESPAPVVALIDGTCMGGGLGLSVHGAFRVVTERALLAMPEVAIGFFPDVGASQFLSRLPGGLGPYLGLTGAHLDPADAINVGLATHYVPAERVTDIPGLLAEDERSIHEVLCDVSDQPCGQSSIAQNRRSIDWIFTANTVERMVGRLRAEGSPWVRQVIDTLEKSSPQAMSLTLDLQAWGRQRTLRQCLAAELDAASHVVRTGDFIEGVRALLVDKDQAPRWRPSRYLGTTSSGQTLWA